MRDRGFRTIVAVLVGLAVIYFGVTGHRSNGGQGGLSGGVVLLALLAALLVWWLLKPGAAK
ncbi:hypothetical protein AB0C02_25470 [Micromonospora sp. NPDC048999]|uniref:hypothetical protein n=1 Tax=Micromonospora sp. NPDC048999 TaxID=3155391 RepID=UPI0033D8006B